MVLVRVTRQEDHVDAPHRRLPPLQGPDPVEPALGLQAACAGPHVRLAGFGLVTECSVRGYHRGIAAASPSGDTARGTVGSAARRVEPNTAAQWRGRARTDALEQAPGVRATHRLGARAHVELVVHVLHVGVDGGAADGEATANLIARQAARDHTQHILLAHR